MRLNDAVLGIAFVIAGAAIVLQAQTFPAVPGQPYGSAFFPRLIGFGLCLVGTILIVQGVRARRTVPWATWPAWTRSHLSMARFAAVPLALVAYILLADPLGFIATSLILLTALQLLLRVRPLRAVAAAVIVTALIEVVFGMLLRVPLPRGIIESLVL